MTMPGGRMRWSYLVCLVTAAGACGGDCIIPPCALPIAFTVSVTAAGVGTPITNATVEVTGAETATVPCNATCMIPGPGGNYHLRISAPGRQAMNADVTVKSHSAKCACETVDMVTMTVPLSQS